jgi:hypothetical protein
MNLLEKYFTAMASVPHDKLSHAASAMVGFLLFGAVTQFLGVRYPMEAALAIMLLIGAAKEAYDYLYNKLVKPVHGVEWLDFAATGIGAATGYACSQLHLLGVL